MPVQGMSFSVAVLVDRLPVVAMGGLAGAAFDQHARRTSQCRRIGRR